MLVEEEINKTERIISFWHERDIIHSSWEEILGRVHENNIPNMQGSTNFWWTMQEDTDIIEALDKSDGDPFFILWYNLGVGLVLESSDDRYNSSLECIESRHMWAIFHEIACRCCSGHMWWDNHTISGLYLDDSWGFSHFKSSYFRIFRIGIIFFSFFSVSFLRNWFFMSFFVRRFALFMCVWHEKSISIFGK